MDDHYRAADDVLNGREFADPSSDILATFEPGELIYLADAGVRLDSGAEWVPTSPDGHFEVWVNRRFLEFVPQVEMAACGEIAEPDPSPGAAVRFHPVAMSPIAVDGCERIVIHLDAGADGRLSDTLTTSIDAGSRGPQRLLAKGITKAMASASDALLSALASRLEATS